MPKSIHLFLSLQISFMGLFVLLLSAPAGAQVEVVDFTELEFAGVDSTESVKAKYSCNFVFNYHSHYKGLSLSESTLMDGVEYGLAGAWRAIGSGYDIIKEENSDKITYLNYTHFMVVYFDHLGTEGYKVTVRWVKTRRNGQPIDGNENIATFLSGHYIVTEILFEQSFIAKQVGKIDQRLNMTKQGYDHIAIKCYSR